MYKRCCHFLLLTAVVSLATTIASASAIATLSASTNGSVKFVNTNGNTSDVTFSFTANCQQGGANCVTGSSLFGSELGTYKMWITGGSPLLTPPSSGTYGVSMNGSTLHVLMTLQDGSVLGGTVVLTDLIGGGTQGPQFQGNFTGATVTQDFVGSYTVGATTFGDFTINLPKNFSVDKVFNSSTPGFTSKGPLSSGELVPVPEPSTLGMMAPALLGIAGLVRKRFSA